MSIGERVNAFAEGQRERPDCCDDKHLEYLDALRESGVTNMYGAVPYLTRSFPELDRCAASAVLGYWMKSFRREDR